MSAWTREKPTKPGAYWYRIPGFRPEVLVLILSSWWRLEVNCQGDTELENYSGEWQGPITPEEEG